MYSYVLLSALTVLLSPHHKGVPIVRRSTPPPPGSGPGRPTSACGRSPPRSPPWSAAGARPCRATFGRGRCGRGLPRSPGPGHRSADRPGSGVRGSRENDGGRHRWIAARAAATATSAETSSGRAAMPRSEKERTRGESRARSPSGPKSRPARQLRFRFRSVSSGECRRQSPAGARARTLAARPDFASSREVQPPEE
jgi:hypothetical protein